MFAEWNTLIYSDDTLSKQPPNLLTSVVVVLCQGIALDEHWMMSYRAVISPQSAVGGAGMRYRMLP